MTESTWREVRGVALWRMRRWTGHPDFEDLCQEALVHVWQVIERGQFRHKATTVAANAADYAALEYLRSKKAFRPRTRAPFAHIDIISLDAIQETHDLNDPGSPFETLEYRLDLGYGDDFAPDLIDAVDRTALLAERMRYLSPKEREVIERYYCGEETVSEIGRAMAISETRVCQLKETALAECRTQARHFPAKRPGFCLHGHALTPENRYPRGRCRICNRANARDRYHRLKEAA